MVPSVSPARGSHDHGVSQSGEAAEDHLLSITLSPWSQAGTTPRKTHVNSEELELGFQGERRKVKLRAAAVCSLIVVVGTACAIAAYHWAWSTAAAQAEHNGYDWTSQVLPEDTYLPIEKRLLYVGIVSPINNFQQRIQARQQWVDEARRYFAGHVKVEFLVGQVPIQTDNMLVAGDAGTTGIIQKAASMDESQLEQRLQDECSFYNDIRRIPVLAETSLFDTDSVLWVFKNAVSWKARFVMKVKDDQVVHLEPTLATLRQRTPLVAPAYFGKVWVQNDMREADGQVSWFYRGDCYGISGDLAHKIAVTHFNHSIGFASYGTSRDDANVAKWVEYENAIRMVRKIIPVKHLWLPNLCTSVVNGTLPYSETRAGEALMLRGAKSPCDDQNPCDRPAN